MIKPLLLFLITGVVLLLFYKAGLRQFYTNKEQMLLIIGSLGMWDEAGFVFLQAVQVVIPVIPGVVLNVLGGYLYGTVVGVIYSSIGTTIGASIAFSLSRKYGKPLVDKFVNEHIRRRLDYVLNQKGVFTIFLLFLIPGFPKDYLCYVLGLGRLTTLQFLAIEGIGRIFGTVLETSGGNYIRQKHYYKLFILVGIAFIIILIVLALRERIERVLRTIHILEYKKKKEKLKKQKIPKPYGGSNEK